MLKLLIALLTVLVVAGIAASLIGARRWHGQTTRLRLQLTADSVPRFRVNSASLDSLPLPVQRYLRLVLRDGQPAMTGASLRHRGSFNLSENAERWRPFTSDQQVVLVPPGFDWNGTIRLLPGVSVRVHDAYIRGEGILHASLQGLISLASQRGTAALAEGELMRFLAESVWYPAVLLPGGVVSWVAAGSHTADATIAADGHRVTLRFEFGEDGLVEAVSTPARGRSVAGTVVPTPWEGRFWNYEERGGVLVPIEGEVAWMLPAGSRPYWRGTLTGIEFLPPT